MKTEILPTGSAGEADIAVAAAVELLRAGAAVALPTETVYGLAADALNTNAVVKIFDAKERPRFDPLIVHLPDVDWLDRVAKISAQDAQVVRALAEVFWRGPLTLVLPRQRIVPDLVTSGLETVAVRVSAHPIFSRVVSGFGSPLAAPSANRFGRISPTTAQHVQAELADRIPLIVDAGPTQHGLESTIVGLDNGVLHILRPGPITREQLLPFGDVHLRAAGAKITAPGQSPSHYAPRTPLVLSDDLRTFDLGAHGRVGALSWQDTPGAQFTETRVLTASGDLREAAANLFKCLRELDAAQLDLIVAETLPEIGLGSAIMDRLRRAAQCARD